MTINNFRWLDSRWIVRLIRGAADKLMRVADSSCRHSPVASQVTYSSVANARPPTPNAMAARKGYEATYQPWYGLPQQVLLLLCCSYCCCSISSYSSPSSSSCSFTAAYRFCNSDPPAAG